MKKEEWREGGCEERKGGKKEGREEERNEGKEGSEQG